jgi:hypothetical protein
MNLPFPANGRENTRPCGLLGIKKGGITTWFLRKKPRLLGRLREMDKEPALRFIHVVRNPFDNIASMHRNNRRSLEENAWLFFQRCESSQSLAMGMPREVLETRHEMLIASPQERLREICRFLGLEPARDYLADWSKIIYRTPHQRRLDLNWSEGLISEMQARSGQFPFLAGYSFEENEIRGSAACRQPAAMPGSPQTASSFASPSSTYSSTG